MGLLTFKYATSRGQWERRPRAGPMPAWDARPGTHSSASYGSPNFVSIAIPQDFRKVLGSSPPAKMKMEVFGRV